MKLTLLILAACVLCRPACAAPQSSASAAADPGRWPEQKAAAWYAAQPWLVGANYVPSDAINQLEMFQPETFNPALNDKELGLAESAGMNTARVFLQDQLWSSDPEGFRKRLDTFLTIAAKHHIRPMLVLFDSCWDPYPKLGPQHPPIPGVHNSGWVQSPGFKGISDPAYRPNLEAYVKGVVGAFANDDRILAWDLWNEPDNGNDSSYGSVEVPHKAELVAALLPQVFAWARSMHPAQPLTSGVWQGDWSHPEKESAMTKVQLAESDILTFHNYGWPEDFEARIVELKAYHRPVLCSEYMARGAGSTFDLILPLARRYNVALINWGLVAGKTQTYLPWDSWQKPYVLSQPVIWFHEVFRQDDTPYRPREVELLRQYTGRGTPQSGAPPAGTP
jgi:hypothetical protein